MEQASAPNPYRLPGHVRPIRYDLRLDPDLATLTFTGEETVTVDVREATSEIVLNAVELSISEATIVKEGSESLRGRIELEEATERCRLTFPTRLSLGTWRLRLRFAGLLNDKLRGFYRSTFQDAEGRTQTLAATQFEATDARRAFPCWDEPDFKAVFRSTLVIDPALTAVSNTSIESERLEGGRKIVQFRETIRMSTYLVAFVVGRIEATAPVPVGRTPLRIWAVPGKRHLTPFGLEIASFSLRLFEEYYGLPYPGDKLDLLAIPDFASGAMENLGAITFRETALLVDPKAATHAELERIADVVAHENAHMWFGDLVTMSWWNGLWLNEAFATFMEMMAVDKWKPEWDRWTTFGVSRAAAMIVDGLHSTRPIEYPVHAPHDADAMFDVLTYEKGASVLRMLEQYLSPDVFRDGVRRYLRAHAYGNADTGDLWKALGDASNEAVPALMDGWIFKPGYPLITARRDASKQGDQLVLGQQRFTYLSDTATRVPHSGDLRWHIPIQLRITAGGRSTVQRLLLKDAEVRIDLPKGFDSVVVNESGHGFYRVRYAPDLRDRLVRQAFKPTDGLSAIERFNLTNDAWATAVSGLIPLADYLELTANFVVERNRNVWTVLLESFAALNRLITAPERPRLEVFFRNRMAPAFADLGWTPRAGEQELTRLLRGDLIRALGTLGNDPSVQRRAEELYGATPDTTDPNILPALITVLAHTGEESRYRDYWRRYKSASTPQEERRYLYALASFRPPALLKETLAHCLDGEIRTQDAPFMVRLVLMSVYGRELAWDFVKREWDRMAEQYPKQGLRRMCEGVVGLTTPELERDVRRFFADRKIDLGGKTLEQYLEQLRIGVAVRERELASLLTYLKKVPS